ncbi:MAG: hypothetical protein DGJ47_001076, partial [Rickettsiaceae bacterium]
MADNRSKLKKLIAGVSAAAIITGAAGSASAAVITTDRDYDFNSANPPNPKPEVFSGDALRYIPSGNTIRGSNFKDDHGAETLYDIIFLDINGRPVGGQDRFLLLSSSLDTNFGSVVGASSGFLPFGIGGGKDLTLTGKGDAGEGIPENDYSSFGVVTFLGNNSQFVIDASGPITLSKNIIVDSFTGNKMEVKTAGTILEGNIASAALPLAELRISSGTTQFKGNSISAKTIVMTGMDFETNGTITVNGNIEPTAPGLGFIQSSENTTTIINGNIGATDAIDLVDIRLNMTVNGEMNANRIELNGLANLTINGTSSINQVFYAPDGAAMRVNDTFTGNVDFNGKAGTFTIGDNVTATGPIDSKASKGGILRFAGAGVADGVIGGTNALSEIQFNGAGIANVGNGNAVKACVLNVQDSGAEAVIDGALMSEDINFNKGGSIQINNQDLGTINVTTAMGINDGTIEVNADQNLTGNIAGFGNFHMNGDKNINLSPANPGGDLSGVSFTTENDNEATLNINKAGVIVGAVGTATEKYKAVNFNQNGTINAIEANTTTIADGVNAGGAIVNGAAKGGTLEFAGSGQFVGDIGTVNPVNDIIFAGPGAATVGAMGKVVNACNINVQDAGSNATINGTLVADDINFNANGTLNINNNDLDDTNINSTVTGATLSVNTGQNLTGNISGFGSFNMNADKTINLDTANTNLSGVAFTTTTDNTATLNIDGAGIVVGSVGTPTEKYKAINFNADSKVNAPIESYYVSLADGVTATAEIDNPVVKGGTVEFKGSGTFDGSIGSTNPVNEIIFSGTGIANVGNGNDVNSCDINVENSGVEATITGPLTTENINFNADGELIISGSDLGATNIAGKATDGKITVDSDQTLTGNITSGLGNFHVNGDKTINLQPANTDLSNVAFTTQTDNTATLNLNTAGLEVGPIGTDTEKFKAVNFNQDATVGEINAYDVGVDDGATATFNGDLNIDNGISLNGPDATAKFGDIVLDTAINPNPGGKIFFNDTDIIADIGAPGSSFTEINFTSTGAT